MGMLPPGIAPTKPGFVVFDYFDTLCEFMCVHEYIMSRVMVCLILNNSYGFGIDTKSVVFPLIVSRGLAKSHRRRLILVTSQRFG